MILIRSRGPASGWQTLLDWAFVIVAGTAIVCLMCLTSCVAKRPPKTDFTKTDAGALSLADAVWQMQKLFGALGSHVDAGGKSLLKYADEFAGDTRFKAMTHVDDVEDLKTRVRTMEEWGLQQERQKWEAMQTIGYRVEFQIRYWTKRLMWGLIALIVAGVIGQLFIGGLTGGLLSWPNRFIAGLLAHGTGIKTPIRLPRKAGR